MRSGVVYLGCRRCGGQLIAEEDVDGERLYCMQCGRNHAVRGDGLEPVVADEQEVQAKRVRAGWGFGARWRAND